MKSFEQNRGDIDAVVNGVHDTPMGKEQLGFTPEALQGMGNCALVIIAAELRTIRQLLEEKAK